jgi:nucleotide-binding universal stress UspA family protein
MIKTILVRATGLAGDAPVFAAGQAIARMFDAHMAFLHVGVDPIQVWEATAASIDTGGLRSAVEGFCEREGVPIHPKFDPNRISASWHTERGRDLQWFPAYGREADLIVAGRASAATDVLGATLFESGRPLLIPAAGAVGVAPETAVIAWKPTREAARAVSAATPILEKCKRIVILSVAEAAENDFGSTDRLVVALRRHGVPVEAEKLRPAKGGAVDAVLDTARNLPSPLLVMGGYGHSRLREMVFGGFTERVMNGADLPVLVAH